MATMTEPPPAREAPSPVAGRAVRRGDQVFAGLARAAGIGVLVVMAAIAIFLTWRSIPSLRADSVSFLTYQQWFPDDKPPVFGIAALAFGTFMTAGSR